MQHFDGLFELAVDFLSLLFLLLLDLGDDLLAFGEVGFFLLFEGVDLILLVLVGGLLGGSSLQVSSKLIDFRLLFGRMVASVRICSQQVSGKLIDFRLLLGCMVASVRIGSQQVSSKLIDLRLLFGYFTTSLTHSSNIL